MKSIITYIQNHRYKKLLFPNNSLRKKVVKTLMYKFEVAKIKITRNAKIHRIINLNSKKIVYIGHSYHSKTKSTRFLIDYLKMYFEVIEVLDDSWQGKEYPNLSFIDKSYLGVVIFQNLPNKKILDSINNDNIIFFPMYDQYGGCDLKFWNQYRKLKIINFSLTLHKKLNLWNFDTMYIQYYPEPLKFSPGNQNKAFFWQRITKLNIRIIVKLLNGYKVKIHIHKAIDPSANFIKPTNDDENAYSITYSDWFKTRQHVHEIIKSCGIYFAPREYEGIGLSFLEAMAMGKAVIAVNNPTMNEYIIDNVNGYLYDLNNPQPINLKNIKNIQKNAYEFMFKGNIKWNKDKFKIIKYIRKG